MAVRDAGDAETTQPGTSGIWGSVCEEVGAQKQVFSRVNNHRCCIALSVELGGGWPEEGRHHGGSEPLSLFTPQNALSGEGLGSQGQV